LSVDRRVDRSELQNDNTLRPVDQPVDW